MFVTTFIYYVVYLTCYLMTYYNKPKTFYQRGMNLSTNNQNRL